MINSDWKILITNNYSFDEINLKGNLFDIVRQNDGGLQTDIKPVNFELITQSWQPTV